MSIETKTVTEIETKTQKKDAKKILFDWADIDDEKEISDVSKQKLSEFSNSHEAEKLKKLYDNYDLVDFVKETGTANPKALKEQARVEQEFAQVAQAVTTPTTAKIELQKLSIPNVNAKKHTKAKLNFRGKLMMLGYSAVVAVMGFLAVFNIVQINNINSENTQIQSQINERENSLNELYNEYKMLSNENRISDIVKENDHNMTKIIGSTSTTKIELRDPKQYTKESNWFDSICNFFSSLFGG